MESITIGDINRITGAKMNLELDENLEIKSISNDSRNIKENSVYVALKGENLDGHEFVMDAIKNGAVAAIVEKSSSNKDILVKDSYKALKQIAIGYKSKFEIPFLSITGSSGKTTTKDMLYYAVSSSLKTLRNLGNFNNEIGLPMTIFNLDSSYECAILEMGMYTLGEIDYLAEIVKPSIAVITNVGVAHMQTAGSRENILKAKMEISNYMTENDTLIINGDNDMLRTIKQENYKFKILTFGIEPENDFNIISYQTENESMKIKAKFIDEEIEYTIPTLGVHNIYNSLSALAVCKVMGLNMKKSAQGLRDYTPSKYRMEIKSLSDKVLVEDFYNANPDSMRASIETFKDICSNRKVAILADMLELGKISESAHKEIGKIASKIMDVLICIGPESENIGIGAEESGFNKANIYYYENNQQAIKTINSILKSGDKILMKGSRGMKLEEVAEVIC